MRLQRLVIDECDYPSFSSPTHLLLPGRSPELALLSEVIALRQLLLPEVAAKKRVAVAVYAVTEVLARHADAGTLPPLQLAIVNKVPLLHGFLTSTSVLV